MENSVKQFGIERNPEQAAAYTLRLLDTYCGSIVAYSEDYRALHGAALAVRKSLELMGAFLLAHHPDSRQREHPVFRGESVQSRLGKNNGELITQFSRDYANICNLEDKKQKKYAVNKIIHYWYSDQLLDDDDVGRERTWEEILDANEKQSLILEHVWFWNAFETFARQVCVVMTAIRNDVLKNDVPWGDYPHIARILEHKTNPLQFPALEEIQLVVEQHYKHSKASPDAWLSWHCVTLSRYQEDAKTNLCHLDTMVVLIRMIAERCAYKYLRGHGEDINTDKAMMSDYRNSVMALSIDPSVFDEIRMRSGIANYLDLLATITNDMIHWSADICYEEETSAEKGERHKRIDEMLVQGSMYMMYFVKAGAPVYVWNWIDYYERSRDLMRGEMENRLAAMESRILALQKKTRIRNRIIAALAAVIAAGICVTAGLYVLRHHEFIARYEDYVWKDGVPQGIYELTKKEAGTRIHYEIATVDGRVRRVERVNAAGETINESVDARLDRSARMEIVYRGDEPDTVMHYDAEGNGLYVHRYAPGMSGVEFYDAENTGHEKYLPADLTAVNVYQWIDGTDEDVSGPSNISEVTLSRRSADGVDVTFGRGIEAYDDVNGIIRIHCEYDDSGRIAAMHYVYGLLLGGDDAADRLMIRRFHYDQANLVRVEDVMQSGNVDATIYEYDAVTGVCTAQRMRTLFDEVRDRGDGVTDIEYTCENGRITETRFLNAAGRLTMNRDGYAVRKQTYDEQNRCTMTAYYNAEERLIVGDVGYAVVRYAFAGDTETISYYNAEGILADNKDGYARVVITRDKDSELYAYFDRNGAPAENSEGMYQRRRYFDEAGRVRLEEALDASGNLMTLPKLMYARYKNVYDASGRLMERRYYDENGRLTGYGPSRKYRLTVLDENSEPVEQNGYAIVKYAYSPKGQMTREEHYGTDDELIAGCAIAEREYDDYGREILRAYRDRERNLIVNDTVGFAQRRTEYGEDSGGTWVQYTYLNEQGETMFNPVMGAAVVRWSYDERGNNTATHLYGEDGSLITSPLDGVAYMVVRFNEKNQAVYWAYYDAQHAPAVSAENGYAAIECVYDKNGRMTAWTYCGTDGEPMVNLQTGSAGEKRVYDDSGNLIRQTYYDADGGFMINEKKGYASAETSFDDHGRKTARTYYDADEMPMIHPEHGYASTMWDYDERGNVVKRTYLDEYGDRMIVADLGYAVVESRFDEKNREAAWTYYDAAEKPVMHPERGYASFERTYDETGIETSWAHYDAEGRLVIPPDENAAAMRSAKQEDGRLLVWFVDEQNETIKKRGRTGALYTQELWTFDEHGTLLAAALLDSEGELVETQHYSSETGELIDVTDAEGNSANNDR